MPIALVARIGNHRRAVGRRRLRLGYRLLPRRRYGNRKGRRNIRVHPIVGRDGCRVVAHRRARPYRAAHLPQRRIVRQAERQAVHPHRRRILRIGNRNAKGGNPLPLRVALVARVGDGRRAVSSRRRRLRRCRPVIVRIGQPQRNRAGRRIPAVRRQRIARRRRRYRIVHIPVRVRIVHPGYRYGIRIVPQAAVDGYIVGRSFVQRNLCRRHRPFRAVVAGKGHDGIGLRFRCQPHRKGNGPAGLRSDPPRRAPARRRYQAALLYYCDIELPRRLIAVAVGSRPGIKRSGLHCRRRTADAMVGSVPNYAVRQIRRQRIGNAAPSARGRRQRERRYGAVLHPGLFPNRRRKNRPRPGLDGYPESSRRRIAVLVGRRPGVCGSGQRHRRRPADAVARRIPDYPAGQRRRQRIADRPAAPGRRRQIKPRNRFALRPHLIGRRRAESQRRRGQRLRIRRRIRYRNAESQPRHIPQPVCNLPGVLRGAHCDGRSAPQLKPLRRQHAPGNPARQRRRNPIAHIPLVPMVVAAISCEPQRIHRLRTGVQPAAHRQLRRRNRLPHLPGQIRRADAAETHRVRHNLHRSRARAANSEPGIRPGAVYPQRNRLPAFAMRPAVPGVDGVRVSLRAAAQCHRYGTLETRQPAGSRRRQVIAVPGRAAGRQRNARIRMVIRDSGRRNRESNPVAFVHLQPVGVGVAVAVIAADGDGNAAAGRLRGGGIRRQPGG